MKYTYLVMGLLLGYNCAGVFLDYAGIHYYGTGTGFNSTEARDAYNKTNVLEGSDLSQQEFYHVGKWLNNIWKLSKTLIFGFYDDMTAVGVPFEIASTIEAVWLFTVFHFFFSMLSGKDYT